MRVLFVCTGNTCRSPMAEGLFRRLAREAGLDVEVKSAGIAAVPGSNFAKHAQTVLKERKADFEGSSTSLTPELLAWADVVLVMTAGHKQALLSRSPEHIDKIHLLKEYVNRNPDIEKKQAELDKLYAAFEMKRAKFMAEHQQTIDQLEERYRNGEEHDPKLEHELNTWRERMREWTREEEEQIRQLEAQLPSFDIADPVGGTRDDYRRTADELESLLRQLVTWLKADR